MSSGVYIDTGILVKGYIYETDSPEAIDILHVTAALEIKCKSFASFDQKQRKVASLAGMKIIPEKRH